MTLKQLWHRLGSPRWFYEMSGPWGTGFAVAAAALLATGTVWGLGFAPPDYQQGNSFRILYVHVPTVMLAQTVYMLLGAAGFVFLVWRMKLADMVLEVMVPFGMGVTAIALFSGAVWGRPTWGAWWVWGDPRILSTLLLLFLYFGLYALRQAIPRAEAASRACALLALVGLVNIPIIKYSVEWWQTLHQGSTFTLTEKPRMPPAMWLPLLVNLIGIYCLFAANLIVRLRAAILRRESGTQWVRETVEKGSK